MSGETDKEKEKVHIAYIRYEREFFSCSPQKDNRLFIINNFMPVNVKKFR